jgi:3-oxoacyl-(acyl-carrier-protein) synthase
MISPVYIAGAGVISAIGNSWSENFFALQHGISGIAEMMVLESVHGATLPVGEVKLTNEELAYRTGSSRGLTRTALLGIHAAKEAYLDSGIKNMKFWRVGVVSGTTVGGMDKTEKLFPQFLTDTSKGKLRNVVNHSCNRSTELIADSLEISDHVTTINTACSSSVNAIMFAARLIQHNHLDVVFAGGTDALTLFTLNGFNSLMILDREKCRPFDASRNGLNLGEGAGFVVLVSNEVAAEENLHCYAKVSGYANTSDAFHQTASSPEGRGSFHAMQKALAMAALSPADIDYINLHGTGTTNNDLSEGTAIKRLFGNDYPALSSTKAFTGHTLGACGGIEAVYSLMSIKHQCIFPNLRFKAPIDETGIFPQQDFDSRKVEHVMSNSFGFGGNCSSIIFSKNTNQRH